MYQMTFKMNTILTTEEKRRIVTNKLKCYKNTETNQ